MPALRGGHGDDGEPAEVADDNGWLAADYAALALGAHRGRLRDEDLCDVIGAESEIRAWAPNVLGSGARGLTQMMQGTLRNLGWQPGHPLFEASGGDFGRASVQAQLDFVFRYFADWRARFGLRRWESRAQLYIANFMPTEIPHAGHADYVLAGEGKHESIVRSNPALDVDGDGAIQVRDAEAFVAHAVATRARPRVLACKRGVALARARLGS